MSEKAEKSSGWLKTIIGTLTGLLSGAIVMYLTPLVDRVIKPAKPVANFGVEHDGLTVTFHNQSTGGHEGWWDFGDGSPLEPVSPQQQVLTHTYPAPSDYQAKLTLRNLIGEENERTVAIHLDAPKSEPPQVLTLEATPIGSGAYAPATFRVTGRAKNATLCVWSAGDDRPVEISRDTPNNQERLVTFARPGNYRIKMVAVNGLDADEKSQVVSVREAPAGSVTASLAVTDQAIRVEAVSANYVFHQAFSPFTRSDVEPIALTVPAKPGFEIADIRLKSATGPGLQGKPALTLDPTAVGCPGARDLKLQLAPDRRSAMLTGQLVREGGKRGGASLSLPVVLLQERRSRAARPPIPVTSALAVPGSATLSLPPLPANWVDTQRQVRVELRDGDRVIWQCSQVPSTAVIPLRGRRYSVTTRVQGNQVAIDLAEVRPGQSASAR